MNPLDERELGRTGVMLTQLGLGGTAVGSLFSRTDEETGVATVREAWRLGLRYFDTAPYYGHGSSERRYGAALRDEPRESFVLSTKVGRMMVDDPGLEGKPPHFADTEPYRSEFDYSPEGIERSIRMSRERTGIDRFDVLFIHDCHDHVEEALAGAYPVLARLREEGVVRAIGAGLNWAETCMALADGGVFDCFLLAGRYTLLEQGAMDAFFPMCEARGIGIVAGGVFNSGILATGPVEGATYQYRPAPAEMMEKARRIENVCARFDVPMAAAAIQFPLGHPVIASVIVGARSPDEIAHDYALMSVPVPAELWEALKREGLMRADAPVPGE